MRPALVACLLLAFLAGCGGDEPPERLLAPSSFKEVVTAEVRKAGLEPDPEAGDEGELRVGDGPNFVNLRLAEAFGRYERAPERRDAIVRGLVDEASRRLEDGVSDETLVDVRDDLMPLLKPPFELRTYGFDPARTPFPGRLAVVYAVDRPEGFTLVRPDDVARWGTTLSELHAVALENLVRRTNREEPLLCEPAGELELCGWASGDGYDATRLVAPTLRRQIAEEVGGEAVYAVPMEHVFVALPLEAVERGQTERLLRIKLDRDFQTSDDPLSREIFVERRGRLVLYG